MIHDSWTMSSYHDSVADPSALKIKTSFTVPANSTSFWKIQNMADDEDVWVDSIEAYSKKIEIQKAPEPSQRKSFREKKHHFS